MAIKYDLPPNPQHAVLKRIYPWDEYDINLVMQWLYAQAKRTGFLGDFDEFKLRYGAFVEASDQNDLYNILDEYMGPYRVTPLINIEQVLNTKNKIINQNIIIEPIPEDLLGLKKQYAGSYQVTPKAEIPQRLRTNDRILNEDIIVSAIPYQRIPNSANGYTAIIG